MTHIPQYYRTSSHINHLHILKPCETQIEILWFSRLRTDIQDCFEWDLRATAGFPHTVRPALTDWVSLRWRHWSVKHLAVPVYPAGQQSVETRQVDLQHAAGVLDVCCWWIRMVLLSSEVQIKVCEENVEQLQQSVMEHDYSWNMQTLHSQCMQITGNYTARIDQTAYDILKTSL